MHQIHVTAASEFIRFATEPHGKKKWLADLVGTRQELVGRWARGERKPSTAMRARLQSELGLDWTLWDAKPDDCPGPETVRALIDAAQAQKAEAAARAARAFPADSKQQPGGI